MHQFRLRRTSRRMVTFRVGIITRSLVRRDVVALHGYGVVAHLDVGVGDQHVDAGVRVNAVRVADGSRESTVMFATTMSREYWR